MKNAGALYLSLVAAFCLFGAAPVSAQDYPSKPLRIIVPTTPGGPQDLMARSLGQEMSKVFGQPIVVENRPGADQAIGLEYVAKQQPADGYTLALVSHGSLAALPALVKDLRFDPLKDLPPVTTLAEQRYVLGSSATKQWKTFQELAAHAKANPGKLNFGAANNNTRMLAEIITRAAGIDVVYVPYAQATAYQTAMASGEVDMGIMAESLAKSFGDRFRILAATGNERRDPLMNVPTFVELGLPSIPGTSYTLNLAAGTPKAVVDKVHAVVIQVLQQPELKSRLANLGVALVADTSEAAHKKLIDDAALYSDVAKKIGL